MLAVNLTQIRNIKRVLLARVAIVNINLCDFLLQDLEDQILGCFSGLKQIEPAMIAGSLVIITIVRVISAHIYIMGYEGKRGHNHPKGEMSSW